MDRVPKIIEREEFLTQQFTVVSGKQWLTFIQQTIPIWTKLPQITTVHICRHLKAHKLNHMTTGNTSFSDMILQPATPPPFLKEPALPWWR
jgi:hypothetical protein